MIRDRQLRYAERELQMQRLLMGKGASRKISGVERVDEDEDAGMGGEGEDEWMDVDGEEVPRLKKAKVNSGAVVVKGARHPRSNRQLAGIRDDTVSLFAHFLDVRLR